MAISVSITICIAILSYFGGILTVAILYSIFCLINRCYYKNKPVYITQEMNYAFDENYPYEPEYIVLVDPNMNKIANP